MDIGRGLLYRNQIQAGNLVLDATPIIYPSDGPVTFEGGLNTKSSLLFLNRNTRFSLKRNQLTRCDNLIRTASGGLITRPGWAKLNSAAIAPPVGDATIRDMAELRRTDGTNVIIAHAGNTVYKWTGSAWSSIGTVATQNTRIHWAQFGNSLFGFDGTNTPVTYDGTTFTTVSGSPPTSATVVVAFRSRLFALSGQTLYFSALSNGNDWTTVNNAGSLPIPLTKGQSGTGLFPFWDRLMVFANNEVVQLTGSSPAIFTLTQVNYLYGHQGSPYGVFAAGNDVYYVSPKGVHSLSVTLARSEAGDVAWDYESGNIEPTWQRIQPTNMGNIIGIHDTLRNLFLVICSTSGATNTEAMVGDYYHLDEWNKPTWTHFTNCKFSSACEVISLNNGKPDILLGGYDGFVYRMKGTSPDTNDAGTSIPVQFQYVTDLELPSWEKTFRAVIVYAQAASGNLTTNASYDFGSRVITQATNLAQSVGDIIGSTFTVGTSTLGTVTFVPHQVNIPGFGRILTLNCNFNASAQVQIGGLLFFAGYRRILNGRA